MIFLIMISLLQSWIVVRARLYTSQTSIIPTDARLLYDHRQKRQEPKVPSLIDARCGFLVSPGPSRVSLLGLCKLFGKK